MTNFIVNYFSKKILENSTVFKLEIELNKYK